MFNSSRPHGLQPTRLCCPWDFPGKSTGVGCHCLLRSAVSREGLKLSPLKPINNSWEIKQKDRIWLIKIKSNLFFFFLCMLPLVLLAHRVQHAEAFCWGLQIGVPSAKWLPSELWFCTPCAKALCQGARICCPEQYTCATLGSPPCLSPLTRSHKASLPTACPTEEEL